MTGAGRAAEPLSVEALLAASNGTITPETVNREDLRNASVIGQVSYCEHNQLSVSICLSRPFLVQASCHIPPSSIKGDKAGLAARGCLLQFNYGCT